MTERPARLPARRTRGRPRAASPPRDDYSLNGSTKDEILRCAGRLFLERGYKGTSVAAIANELGITAAALYWHFDSKIDILAQFLESTFKVVLERVEADRGQSQSVRLRELVAAQVRGQLDLVQRMDGRRVNFTGRQLLEALPAKLRPSFERAEDEYVHICAEVLRAGVESGEFDCSAPIPTAFAIVNMCDDSNLWFRPNGSLSAEEVVELYADLVMRMVLKRPGGPDEQGGQARKRRAASVR
jgi:AcrR family transcriptional regulator